MRRVPGTSEDAMSDSTAIDRPLAVTPVPVMTDTEIERTWRVAKALAASNFFKDARQAEAAFAKILLGRDLGLSPTEAMQALHVFDGKVEASADFHATRVKRTPGYDYRVAWEGQAADKKGAHPGLKCIITYTHEDEEIGVSDFSWEDAARAGLTGKDVWQKYPRNMLFARAMSNGVAWFCPEVMGSVRVYSEGEVEEVVDAVEMPSREQEDERLNAVAVQFPQPVCARIIGTVERARELGHAGIADVAALEMALLNQDTQAAEDWCAESEAELDRHAEAQHPPEVVDAEPEPRCEAPDPVRKGVVCVLLRDHEGPHYADDQTWEPFLPDQAGDATADAERAQALRDEANTLLDRAQELREAIMDEDGAAGLEAEAEAKRDEADQLDPPQPDEGGLG
jgi:hypothetical protein